MQLSDQKKNQTPQERDETSVSGHMPDPEADDNIDDQLEKVGLYGDSEEAEPLNIAKEVNEAEKNRRGSVNNSTGK